MIQLKVLPDALPSWPDFVRDHGPFAIALDGFVPEAPHFDPVRRCVNFNHHEGVARLETRATCAQAWLAVRQGLYSSLCHNGQPEATLYVNDCDEDVCLSTFVLMYGHTLEVPERILLNRLVGATDLLDSTAGAFVFAEEHILPTIAWIYRPYREFRLSGQLAERDPSAFLRVIREVHDRIWAYFRGEDEEAAVDTSFEILGSYPTWLHVREIGEQAKFGIFAQTDAFVTSSPYGTGWMHILGRRSEFIPFPVPDLLACLSDAEKRLGGGLWGGGTTIGGSPRQEGSRLSPEAVAQIIQKVLNDWKVA